jgi:hypothetical protein
MKRFFFITLATLALLVPAIASAQGVTLVYRPELHGMVTVPVPPAPATLTSRAPTPAPTPLQIIARHQAMAVGFRTNGSANSGLLSTVAVDHCERLIARARATLRQSF